MSIIETIEALKEVQMKLSQDFVKDGKVEDRKEAFERAGDVEVCTRWQGTLNPVCIDGIEKVIFNRWGSTKTVVVVGPCY